MKSVNTEGSLMTLTDEIQLAIKANKAIIGYRKSIKFIKTNSPKAIVLAENAPEKIKREIEYNVKISNFTLKIFDGGSKKLGVVCGKPFPVTTLIIKG